MSVEEFTKLTDALTRLLAVLIRPALLAFVLLRFGPAVKDFFSSCSDTSSQPSDAWVNPWPRPSIKLKHGLPPLGHGR